MFPATCNIALKEWAVTVKALDRGEQILTLRKGGIREEGKEFRVIYPDFLLYPTFEHQKDELIKAPYYDDLQETLLHAPGPDRVTISHWAKVHETFEVMDQEKVDSLSEHYIWTTGYAQKRLHWKPRKPLIIVLLRVFRLGRPKTIHVTPEYEGCKSWVNLTEDVPLDALTPVLSEKEFLEKAEEVHKVLGTVSTSV